MRVIFCDIQGRQMVAGDTLELTSAPRVCIAAAGWSVDSAFGVVARANRVWAAAAGFGRNGAPHARGTAA